MRCRRADRLQPPAVGPLPRRRGEAPFSGERISGGEWAVCHAVELNGLRHWDENREVATLAAQWNQLLICGGDRHGVEPNANVNLTRATSFTEFVHEVGANGKSHVLFMPQYAEPWKHRILNSTLDAIRDYPEFPEGSRRWDERVYHPDAEGMIQPLSQLWKQAGPLRVLASDAGGSAHDGGGAGFERAAPGVERYVRVRTTLVRARA